MRSIEFLPAAADDYSTARRWYAERSPQAALAFETAVDAAVERIAERPESWPLCDERHRYYILRRFPFSLIYRFDGDHIIVVAVAHSSRESTYWFTR
ncbi:MAG: type II toxin-antitoxin system RelE/ParE family toxin [Planctomycetaceae bacterium]|nr:type II toxin-antitoxin system RelE/ParE family toxin [Planctomycetaceae bacterium]